MLSQEIHEGLRDCSHFPPRTKSNCVPNEYQSPVRTSKPTFPMAFTSEVVNQRNKSSSTVTRGWTIRLWHPPFTGRVWMGNHMFDKSKRSEGFNDRDTSELKVTGACDELVFLPGREQSGALGRSFLWCPNTVTWEEQYIAKRRTTLCPLSWWMLGVMSAGIACSLLSALLLRLPETTLQLQSRRSKPGPSWIEGPFLRCNTICVHWKLSGTHGNDYWYHLSYNEKLRVQQACTMRQTTPRWSLAHDETTFVPISDDSTRCVPRTSDKARSLSLRWNKISSTNWKVEKDDIVRMFYVFGIKFVVKDDIDDTEVFVSMKNVLQASTKRNLENCLSHGTNIQRKPSSLYRTPNLQDPQHDCCWWTSSAKPNQQFKMK